MSDDWNFPKGDLMKGKKGLVMGVANDKSIAWGIACQLAAQGADIAFSYLGESLLRRVQPLAESIGVKHLIECDVTSDESMDAAFAKLKDIYGEIDFLIHSVAFANKNELQGSFVENTTREGFLLAMNVSAFSFVDSARRAAELMPNGGSMVTLTYLGSERVIPNYNTMAWPRRRWRRPPATSPAIWGRRESASTRSRRAPCAPCRWPGFPAGAACTPSRASSRP